MKKIFMLVLLIFTFLISSEIVYAKTASKDACYCCGAYQSCTYSWKKAGTAVGDNCTAVSSKTINTCNGTARASGSDVGACWYCEPVAQSKYYRWTTDGSNPNPNYCHVVNGRTQSACTGVPISDPNSGSNSGSNSGEDEEYGEYEDTDGPDINSPSTSGSCSGIIGSGRFRGYLTDILDAMRIVGVAMVVIFSTLDFGKALVTQDNDAMKKASEKSMKRLLIAMVVFFTPILLNILLGLTGIDKICI